MINIEWTANTVDFIVLSDGKEGGAQVLRTIGMIDAYDYLDLDWIADAASAALGQQLAFADRFDDRRDPFNVDSSLKNLYPQVVTDYTLEPNANYVKMVSTFVNPSKNPISMPVGDFLVGGGELQVLVPGQGFAPPATAQVGQTTPAVIFAGFPGVDVSYGYFYELKDFIKPTDKEKENQPEELYMTTALSYSGVTGVLLGEEFLKILPVGSHAAPEIHFVIPAESRRSITRYFVVGDGTAGSVLDTGLDILNVPTASISGQVMAAGGAPIQGATVAVKKLGGGTIVTYVTDVAGRFHGKIPTGADLAGRAFGSGKYEVWVNKEGYHQNTTARAGTCSPAQIDVTRMAGIEISCILGETGYVQLGSVTDAATGMKIPARLTIVGLDPSPETGGGGTFSDTNVFTRPFGIIDVKIINAAGGVGLSSQNTFALEPGMYRFVFSHGPEYSIVEKAVTLGNASTVAIPNIVLKKVVATPGFVAADFHIHTLNSPDSGFSVERRAIAAVADGLDVLHSSDHDFLTDFAPVVGQLVQQGLLAPDSVQTIVGNEITPNHYGHLHAFPLTPDFDDVDHGALDWSMHPLDEVSTAPDYSLSPRQIVNEILKDPGEEVIQINHISDSPSGLPVAAGWLTTPIYEEKFGVPAFVSYADPIERRLSAPTNRAPAPPYTMNESELILDNFTAIEVVIGPDLNSNQLWESALPTWFNLLNLGLMPTATGNSDSHHEISAPLGMPRNYVAMHIDPRDGLGESFSAIDENIYTRNINNRRVVVSAGPFIMMTAKNEKGKEVGVGEIIEGKSIQFTIHVEAPDWAWFDTIEIYANTEPLPAEDSGRFAMRGEAESPWEFAKQYHVPRYTFDAVQKYKLSDGSLKNWKQKDGKITADVEMTINVKEDTWVVVAAKGTPGTEGYRSLFPVVPDVLKDGKTNPENFDPLKLDLFHADEN
ncbi:MAG: CehA/McbA family metallohydrolase, partial [bacterium]|nr:CehA/McbA family metallohydrolase [bacterium]